MEAINSHQDESPARVDTDRVKALKRYQVLDMGANINFDDFTFLAGQICNTPIAMVTLIDERQAWIKSPIGLDLMVVDREDVVCNQTIEHSDVLVIEDLHSSKRFCDNRFVTHSPFLRFYAGAPLIDRSGFALGTLCVLDYVPRSITDQQINSLNALARQIVHTLESKISKERLKKDFYELQRLNKINLDNQIKIVHTARMTSLGEMANGIAHEVNSPLSVIDHAIEKMNRTHRYEAGAVFMIQKAIRRITRIISGLRFMAQDGASDPFESLNVRGLLFNTIELYASRAKEEGISFKLDSDDNHYLYARQSQVTQILMNLMLNAFQAVSDVSNKWIALKSYQAGEEMVIEFTDSGKGIPIKDQDKVFEPFFTTKPHLGSTGVGLVVSKKLAEENGGSLTLDKTSDHTKFILRFKITPRKSSPERDPGSRGPLQ